MTYPYKVRITGLHSIEINEMTDEEIEWYKEQKRLKKLYEEQRRAKRMSDEKDCKKQLYFDFLMEVK